MISRRRRASSLYQTLEDELREGILNGRFSKNEPLPSEPELCRQYQLSRTTVRKALQRLADMNMLRRIHGAGTFIIPAEERSHLARKFARIRVIVPYVAPTVEQMDAFDRDVILGVNTYARLHSYEIEITKEAEQPERKLLADYHNFRMDGVIWIRANNDALRKAATLRDSHIPQVLIARDLPGVPGVYFDSAAAIRDSVQFLKNIGHSHIVFLDLKSDFPVYSERQRCFSDVCRDLECIGYCLPVPVADVYEALSSCLDAHPEISAILSAIPMINIMSKVLEDRKIRIPEDLSVIQLGQNKASSSFPWTSITMSLQEIGEKAAELITTLDYRTEIQISRTLVAGSIILGPSIASPQQNHGRRLEK